MTIRLKTESRACLLDSTQPGSLVHDVLAGRSRYHPAGDPPAGLYEIDCSDTDCQELMRVTSKHCPDACSRSKRKSAVRLAGDCCTLSCSQNRVPAHLSLTEGRLERLVPRFYLSS